MYSMVLSMSYQGHMYLATLAAAQAGYFSSMMHNFDVEQTRTSV